MGVKVGNLIGMKKSPKVMKNKNSLIVISIRNCKYFLKTQNNEEVNYVII